MCGAVPVMIENCMLGPAPSYEQAGSLSFFISLSLASGSVLQSEYSSDHCPLSVSKLVSNKYACKHACTGKHLSSFSSVQPGIKVEG